MLRESLIVVGAVGLMGLGLMTVGGASASPLGPAVRGLANTQLTESIATPVAHGRSHRVYRSRWRSRAWNRSGWRARRAWYGPRWGVRRAYGPGWRARRAWYGPGWRARGWYGPGWRARGWYGPGCPVVVGTPVGAFGFACR